MINWIIRFFGLKGSWMWACRQMDAGNIIRPASASGGIKYRLDPEAQRRIQWTFHRFPTENRDWESAKIFLSDFEDTDWALWQQEPTEEDLKT